MGMELRSSRQQQPGTAKRIAVSVLTATLSNGRGSSTRELFHTVAESSPGPKPPPAKKPRRSSSAAKTTLTPFITSAAEAGDPHGDKVLYSYPTLVPARLIRRYKRFLADVVLVDPEADDNDADTTLDESQAITIYCPNTGPMVGLLEEPLVRVQLSKSDDPKRKYAYTLEMVRIHNGERHVWVGVHSTSANYMVERALLSGWFTAELGKFHTLQREVKFSTNSRVDFVLSTHDEATGRGDAVVIHQKYVEVKSVTLAVESGSNGDSTTDAGRCAVFPDTVSDRAAKHVTELIELIEKTRSRNEELAAKGLNKAVTLSGAIVFLVQRDDCASFMPSHVHDPKFAALCAKAETCGIQLVAYACELEPEELHQQGRVRLVGALPLDTQRAVVADHPDHEDENALVPSKSKSRKPTKKATKVGK